MVPRLEFGPQTSDDMKTVNRMMYIKIIVNRCKHNIHIN